MSGVHVLQNVEEEIKRDQEDVTILFLNLVDLNVTGISLNANVVIWIHARLHAQHKQ